MDSTQHKSQSSHQIKLLPILCLDNARTRIPVGPIDDQLPHEVNVMSGDWIRESKLSSKHGRDTDLVRINVYVWRDDGASGVVNTFPLTWLVRPGQGYTV